MRHAATAVAFALMFHAGAARAALIEISARGQLEELSYSSAGEGDLVGVVPFAVSIILDGTALDQAAPENARGLFPGAIRAVRVDLDGRALVFRGFDSAVDILDRFNGFSNDEELVITGFGLVDVYAGADRINTLFGEYTLSLGNSPEPGAGNLLASKQLEDLPQLRAGWESVLVDFVAGDLALGRTANATRFRGSSLEFLSASVPEPGAAVMLLLGAGGAVVFAAYRRKS